MSTQPDKWSTATVALNPYMLLAHGQVHRMCSAVLVHDNTGVHVCVAFVYNICVYSVCVCVCQHVRSMYHHVYPTQHTPSPTHPFSTQHTPDHVLSNAITLLSFGTPLEHSVGSVRYAVDVVALTVLSGLLYAGSAWVQARMGWGAHAYYLEGLVGSSNVAYGIMVR